MMVVSTRKSGEDIKFKVIPKVDTFSTENMKMVEKKFPFLSLEDRKFDDNFIINHFPEEMKRGGEVIIIVNYDTASQRIITLSINKSTMLMLMNSKRTISLEDWLDTALSGKYPEWDNFKQNSDAVLFKVKKTLRLTNIITEVALDVMEKMKTTQGSLGGCQSAQGGLFSPKTNLDVKKK